MMRFIRYTNAHAIRTLESVHFTFFTTFSIFLVKYRQERHKRRQGCFYYTSIDIAALVSIIITTTTQQLFSLLKCTVHEREREALS
jgi:hypothetical protein